MKKQKINILEEIRDKIRKWELRENPKKIEEWKIQEKEIIEKNRPIKKQNTKNAF